MTMWLTSDTHINHDKDWLYGTHIKDDGTTTGRGFATVQDMNQHIFDTIFAQVQPGDTIVHLGDLAMSKDKVQIATDFVSKLDEIDVHLIWKLGNHDPMPHRLEHLSSTIIPMDQPFKIAWMELSHFPYRGSAHKNGPVDPREDHLPFPVDEGRPLLHGHTHRSERLSRSPMGTPMIHVGWDCRGRLVSLDEVIRELYP